MLFPKSLLEPLLLTTPQHNLDLGLPKHPIYKTRLRQLRISPIHNLHHPQQLRCTSLRTNNTPHRHRQLRNIAHCVQKHLRFATMLMTVGTSGEKENELAVTVRSVIEDLVTVASAVCN